jgi:tubulin monoglycylase TTLL3/8
MRGHHNAWILKPSGHLMGSGIELGRSLPDIQALAKNRRFMAWVAQKYIENPLLVEGRKFDIRQWALVTMREGRPAVYMCQQALVRFAALDYDERFLDSTHMDKEKRQNLMWMHLTNSCISKQHPDFNYEDEWNSFMWASERFAQWSVEKFGKNLWEVEVQAQMQQVILKTLDAVIDQVMWKEGSFQWLGYDFMVSDDWHVWLIEVNSNPSAAGRTTAMREMVHGALRDTPHVVATGEERGVWQQLQWEPQLQQLEPAAALAVEGKQMRRKEEKRGGRAAGPPRAAAQLDQGARSRGASLPAIPARRRTAAA